MSQVTSDLIDETLRSNYLVNYWMLRKRAKMHEGRSGEGTSYLESLGEREAEGVTAAGTCVSTVLCGWSGKSERQSAELGVFG